jgi:hypothetical protein
VESGKGELRVFVDEYSLQPGSHAWPIIKDAANAAELGASFFVLAAAALVTLMTPCIT